MESKKRLILKHKTTGYYYGNDATLTKKLWDAWRFYDMDYIMNWLAIAHFAPKDSSQYEIVQVEMQIEELPNDV